MNKSRPKDIYEKRTGKYREEIVRLKKISAVLSTLKFIVLFSGLFLLLQKKSSMFILGVLFLAFFVISIIHEKYVRKEKWRKLLLEINENEIEYLNYKFSSFDNGSRFFDEEHRYAEDMDIFGERGVYHYLNRTQTILGRNFLAGWLTNNSDLIEVKRRQEAVKELSKKIDFRQSLQALGMHVNDSSLNLKGIYKLFDEPFLILGKKLFIIYFHLFPLLTLTSLVLIFFNFPWAAGFSFVLTQLLVNHFNGQKVSRIYQYTHNNCKILKVYSNIIREIESQSFESKELSSLRAGLLAKEKPASKYIKRLSNLSEFFDLRLNNIFYFILNNTMFWDFHCMYRIEKWVKDVKEDVHNWLDAVGKVDALCSFGNLSFNHPDWAMPEFFEQGFKLEAISIGHPLIPGNERINNDIKFNEDGRIVIVTGPNMAGKSTFLRTMGVNIALAFAGAPVCAKHLSLSPLKLYSSMKISDSLDKKLSLFYKELQHLKRILDGIIKGEPVFFIIDEMLKGTNTGDRRQGAIALLKQLINFGAHGIAATHDLELAALEKAYPLHILNYHFDGYVDGDQLLFDYKLKKGVCRNFNALTLMRKIGIQV